MDRVTFRALPAGIRQENRTRWLCAAYADLDCYRKGLTFGDAHREILAAQEAGAIPPASIIAKSGRGAWLFFLLRGADGDGPIAANRESRAAYLRLQRYLVAKIGECLPKLGVDAGAHDIARVTRVPSSIHGGSGDSVRYHIQAGTGLRPFVYTLPELEDAFHLPRVEPPRHFRPAKARSTGEVPKRVNGYLARHTKILEELDSLAVGRGGIPQGCRSRAVLTYATFLLRIGHSFGAVESQARAFGTERCTPALPDREISAAVRGARGLSGKPPTNRTLASWLGVTNCEADALDLQQIRPDFVPQADRLKPRKIARELRRAELRRISTLR